MAKWVVGGVVVGMLAGREMENDVVMVIDVKRRSNVNVMVLIVVVSDIVIGLLIVGLLLLLGYVVLSLSFCLEIVFYY